MKISALKSIAKLKETSERIVINETNHILDEILKHDNLRTFEVHLSLIILLKTILKNDLTSAVDDHQREDFVEKFTDYISLCFINGILIDLGSDDHLDVI